MAKATKKPAEPIKAGKEQLSGWFDREEAAIIRAAAVAADQSVSKFIRRTMLAAIGK